MWVFWGFFSICFQLLVFVFFGMLYRLIRASSWSRYDKSRQTISSRRQAVLVVVSWNNIFIRISMQFWENSFSLNFFLDLTIVVSFLINGESKTYHMIILFMSTFFAKSRVWQLLNLYTTLYFRLNTLLTKKLIVLHA